MMRTRFRKDGCRFDSPPSYDSAACGQAELRGASGSAPELAGSFDPSNDGFRRWMPPLRQQLVIARFVAGALIALSLFVARSIVADHFVGYDSCRPLVETRDALTIRSSSLEATGVRFDLNTCRWQELCLFPGVNRTLAQRIIELRGVLGSFRSWDELERVAGVGRKKIAALRAHPQLELNIPKPPSD